MNKAEQFVFQVCKRTFLSLWSYANPLGRNNKELCDILIVCEPDIIIVSVKEVKVTKSKDITIDWKRWNKKAVEDSVKQIYGAERWIKSSSNVVRKDGTKGLALPKKEEQRIHRVAVALRREEKVPLFYGDFGKGFVHVLDEISFNIILQELDTIKDFINYLSAKEEFYSPKTQTPLLAGEENLLAFYLSQGRKFPDEYDSVFLDDNLWESIIKKSEFKKRKEADQISYVWDRLIDDISKSILENKLEFSSSPGHGEIILRAMAREDRFSRRMLGRYFAEFIALSSKNILRARMLPAPSGVFYVFLAIPHTIERKYRIAELGTRCFVAKGLNQDFDTVIGIATEQYKPGIGHSFDLYYLHKPDWTEKDQTHMEGIQKDCGFFVNSVKTEAHEDEYPKNSFIRGSKMRIHPVQIGSVEATAIEDIPIGAICIVPTVLDKNILLSDDERLLIEKKANLLCRFLQDEQFLFEVASLYEDQINLPPLMVSFNRFSPDDRGAGFDGNTSDLVLDIEGQEGRLIELNLLDADARLRDVDRLFYLWKGFFSLALCHSPRRPDDNNKVVTWSEAEAKRAWLLAIKREKIKNPKKKYVMGIERSHIIRARPTPFDPSNGTILLTFPIHFQSAEEYRRKFNREYEHLFPEPNFDDILDYWRSPPWRWNNTAGFVDVYETQERGLVADIHIATTYRKIKLHGSVEAAKSSASSGKIYSFFNNLIWKEAFFSGNPNGKLETFLELIATYIECVFNWNIDIDQLRPIIHKIKI